MTDIAAICNRRVENISNAFNRLFLSSSSSSSLSDKNNTKQTIEYVLNHLERKT